MRQALTSAVFGALVLALFFAPGGSLAWTRGWLLLDAIVACAVVHGAYVRRRNPELAKARERIGEGTARWDYAWNPLWWLLLFSAPAVAGVEQVRFGHDAWPLPWAALGGAVLAAGFTVSARAMAVNRFFEGTVRLQQERGHQVVDAGPYRVVRHPGYVGLALWAVAQPLIVGSTWAVGPAVAAVAWVVLRTALEDAFLRKGLEGYEDYARRVRWRLVPGVW